MVKESARKCSHCGHYGHNSRTCNSATSFRLFGANIGKSTKTSMNMENLLSDDVHVDAGSPSVVKRGKESKKGIAWTEKEHSDFLAGLNMLGKGNWKGISMHFVKTRNPSQVASHAQKYFLRLASTDNKNRRASIFDVPYQQSALPTCQDSIPVKSTAANFSSSQANNSSDHLLNRRFQDNICQDPLSTVAANSNIPRFCRIPYMVTTDLTSNLVIFDSMSIPHKIL
ncbi:hypothetical protein LWI28_019070 [Acer negundo]|uniref:Uncharacterized protein n=1 Tax=Acer negundo TaxID=4023 RepID=A0AAD5IG43_ACENE|nr:hypothetical protein LWI28_019070 [Acer negundo]